MILETITANTATTKVRRQDLEGRPHLVVPCVMMVEGVLNGSKGPLYYPKEEMAKNPQAWDHRPVMVYHPTKNGKPSKAADPDALNTQKIGLTLNTKYVSPSDGKPVKLRTEVWLDEERTKKVAPGLLSRIEKGEPVEVSTGLYTENEDKPGKFKDKDYVAVARQYVPDHLAVLPTGVGACSVKDGAGLLVNKNKNGDQEPTTNAMSYNRIHQQVQKCLDEQFGAYNVHAQDVYPKFVIFAKRVEGGGQKLYKQEYKFDQRKDETTRLALTGTPEPVERVTEYRTPSGEFVGNSLYGGQFPKEFPMTKAERVAALISNSGGTWTKDDEAYLLTKDEAWLTKIAGGTTSPTPTPVVANSATVAAAVPVPTFGDLFKSADPETQAVINEAIESRNRERASLTATITANKANTFKPEQLAKMDLPTLRGIAQMVAPTPSGLPVPNYLGAGGAAPVVANEGQGQQQKPAPALPQPPSTKRQSK